MELWQWAVGDGGSSALEKTVHEVSLWLGFESMERGRRAMQTKAVC